MRHGITEERIIQRSLGHGLGATQESGPNNQPALGPPQPTATPRASAAPPNHLCAHDSRPQSSVSPMAKPKGPSAGGILGTTGERFSLTGFTVSVLVTIMFLSSGSFF